MFEKLHKLYERLSKNTTKFNQHLSEEGYLENCMTIVEAGWQEEFNAIPHLKPFMKTADPVENLFVRRYLLKLLSEAYASGRLKNYDGLWHEIVHKNLSEEFDRLTEGAEGYTWADSVCFYEPTVITSAYGLFYTLRSIAANEFFKPRLNNLLMLTLSTSYVTLTYSGIIPHISSVIRDQFLRSPEAKRMAQQKQLLLEASFETDSHFYPSSNTLNALQEVAVKEKHSSAFEKMMRLHDQLKSSTQNFNSHFAVERFVEDCLQLAEKGWDAKFEGTALVPFKTSGQPFEDNLKQLYLLKLIRGSTASPEQLEHIQHVRLEDLSRQLERSSRVLRYHGSELRTANDLNNLRANGTAQLMRYQPILPTALTILLMDPLWLQLNLSTPVRIMITLLVLASSFMYLSHLYKASSKGLRTLFFADRIERRFEQQGIALLEDAHFKNNFLLTEGKSIAEHRLSHATSQNVELLHKNSRQALFGGIALMCLSFVNNRVNNRMGPTAFCGGFVLVCLWRVYEEMADTKIRWERDDQIRARRTAPRR